MGVDSGEGRNGLRAARRAPRNKERRTRSLRTPLQSSGDQERALDARGAAWHARVRWQRRWDGCRQIGRSGAGLFACGTRDGAGLEYDVAADDPLGVVGRAAEDNSVHSRPAQHDADLRRQYPLNERRGSLLGKSLFGVFFFKIWRHVI